MEGLLQPTHLILILLIVLFVVVPIIITLRVARYRRARCTWPETKAKQHFWVGIGCIIVSVLSPPFLDAPTRLPLEVPCWFLLMVAVYQVSKAVYRKQDIKAARATAI